VAVVELKVGIEVDGCLADRGDGEGFRGAEVFALHVAVGETVPVAAGDLESEGVGGDWVAAVGVAGDIGLLLRGHEGDVFGEAVVETGGWVGGGVAVGEEGGVDGVRVAVAVFVLAGVGSQGEVGVEIFPVLFQLGERGVVAGGGDCGWRGAEAGVAVGASEQIGGAPGVSVGEGCGGAGAVVRGAGAACSSDGDAVVGAMEVELAGLGVGLTGKVGGCVGGGEDLESYGAGGAAVGVALGDIEGKGAAIGGAGRDGEALAVVGGRVGESAPLALPRGLLGVGEGWGDQKGEDGEGEIVAHGRD
jgi:hypothetical protein